MKGTTGPPGCRVLPCLHRPNLWTSRKIWVAQYHGIRCPLPRATSRARLQLGRHEVYLLDPSVNPKKTGPLFVAWQEASVFPERGVQEIACFWGKKLSTSRKLQILAQENCNNWACSKKQSINGVNTEGALCYKAWSEALLPGDPKRTYLLDGIKNGFKITTQSHTGFNVWQNNYKSATCAENLRLVEQQICEELNNGRYKLAKSRPQVISALGSS